MGHGLWVNEVWARRGDPVAYRLVFVGSLIVRISAETNRTEDGFTGFILQARDIAGVVQGVFDLETSSEGVKALGCVTDSDTVTHRDAAVKQSVDLVWKALEHCSFDDVHFQ